MSITVESHIMSEPKKPRAYLSNASLLDELKRCHEKGKMTDEMAKMLRLLTDRYASKPSLAGYPEDMRQYAMYMLVRTWKAFKPELSQNPFAFFTQCIKNSFYQYLNREKRQRMIRDRLAIMSGLTPSHGCQVDHEEQQRANRDMGDMIDDDYYEPSLSAATDVELDTAIKDLAASGARDQGDDDESVLPSGETPEETHPAV